MSKTIFPGSAHAVIDKTKQSFDSKFSATTITPNVLVLHSTEGWGWPAYDGGAMAPNMTVKPDFANERLLVRQHIPANHSARALEHRPGTIATNTLDAFQIEIVGTCDPRLHAKTSAQHLYTADLPDWAIQGLAEILLWLNAGYELKVQDATPRGWAPYPASGGDNAKTRMTDKEWSNAYGVCGHEHVPHNSHGDPGAFPIAKLIAAAKGTTAPPVVTPPPAKAVPVWGKPETWTVGGVSADVKRLAERLVVHGFESFYGNGTDTTFTAGEDQVAVKAFQESQGWSGSDADGFPGMQTFALLEADPVASAPDPTPAVTTPTLRPARATGTAPAKIPSSMSKMYHVASDVWYAVEDSLPGLEAAEALGYPWADVDIHVTKDGVLVCGHDTSPSDDHFVISAAFKKKYGSHPNIENMTWADVSTLRTPPTKFRGATITLRYYKVDEILAWLGEHPKMSVSFELKQSLAFEKPATFEALRDMAIKHGVDPKRLAIMSIARPAYDHLARFKAAHPYFPTMVLPHDLAKPNNWASVQPYVDYYRGSWAK